MSGWNGLGITNATEQYALGLAHGKQVAAQGLDADALARRVRFDQHMVSTCSETFAAFHRGRIEGLTGTTAP